MYTFVYECIYTLAAKLHKIGSQNLKTSNVYYLSKMTHVQLLLIKKI